MIGYIEFFLIAEVLFRLTLSLLHVPVGIPQPGTMCAWRYSPVKHGMCLQAHRNIGNIIYKIENGKKWERTTGKPTKTIGYNYRRRVALYD